MKSIIDNIKYIALCMLVISFGCDNEDKPLDTSPVAAFSVDSEEIEKGTTIKFVDASFDQHGSISKWSWDFGNGDTSIEQSPSYTYEEKGEYKVILTVTDTSGKVNVNEFSKIIKVLQPSTATIVPSIIWSYSLPGKVEESSAAVSEDGVVYIGCSAPKGSPNIFAIYNGNLKWSYTSGDIIRSSPAIHENGNIYLGSYDNNLYGFSPSGSLEMLFDMGNNAKYSGPVFGLKGEIYIGSQTDELIAVDAGGNELWRYNTGGDVNGTPAIGKQGEIYVGSTNGSFYSLMSDGTLNWVSEYGAWTATATAIGPDETVYFAGEGNNQNPDFGGVFIAFNPNGTEKWRVGTESKINHGGPSIAADGTIYIGGHSKELMAISPDGTLKWKYPTKGNILSTPAVDNEGNIYVGDDQGYFYVIDVEGNKKWKEIQLGVKIWNSPAIGNDGLIYIAADQNDDTALVYALDTNVEGLANGGWPMRSKTAQHSGR